MVKQLTRCKLTQQSALCKIRDWWTSFLFYSERRRGTMGKDVNNPGYEVMTIDGGSLWLAARLNAEWLSRPAIQFGAKQPARDKGY